jgi:hypothetical protein
MDAAATPPHLVSMRAQHGAVARFALAALCAAGAVPALRAQAGPPPAEPVEVVEAFFTALRASHWADAAAWLDPAGLQAIRRRYLNSPAFWGYTPPAMTVDDYLRNDPDMPWVVAEYFARQAEKHPLPAFSPLHQLGVDSITQLARMTIEELGYAWVKGHDERYRMRESLKQAGCPAPPPLDSMPGYQSPKVYGAIPGDSNEVFVLVGSGRTYSTTLEEGGPLPSIARLRRTPAGWRIVPREDLLRPSGVISDIRILDCAPRRPS